MILKSDILGQKYNTTNKFSWKPSTVVDLIEAENKRDINNFILVELSSFRVLPIFLNSPTLILIDNDLDAS